VQPVGAYSADRASALSGVPKSTIHYWSRHELLEPSVSSERRLSGSPHVVHTRLETLALDALDRDGLDE
jgi:DNA-binding transcriptional MerR regulator